MNPSFLVIRLRGSMAEVADKIAARENDAFLARWRAVLQRCSVRRIVVITRQMRRGQVARLANVRHVETLIPSAVRVRAMWRPSHLGACSTLCLRVL